MMNKPAKHTKQAELKTQINQSHTDSSPDAHIIALVRSMARRAAEEYFRTCAAEDYPDKGGN
ncbi:MAG: hypothetical protein JMN24_02645 [gamma proteobacterium endosymbiont of Lamellibrachia anaximandri]|nr:hypothetical protein [gamma proteobacterium endosymbiont of Lamellibrachia anaximandri]MBL3619461.1 hypothetical protein [gamma proteobacterium endosymbiont of Lamellibrachia anaximandri]